MDSYYFEIWDNGKRELRYTILRNDGLAWICGKNKRQRNDKTEPVFIGPVGPRKKYLGKQLSQEDWPPTIHAWLKKRIRLQNQGFV